MQKNLARLKIQKGSLGKRQRKRLWARQIFIEGRHGQKLHSMEKRKEKEKEIKIMTISKDNKWNGSLIAQSKR